jgi:MtN3 and saliva related transmembrane protein
MSHLVEPIGYAAGVLTTLAFVPQVVKTWRSRSSGDLSFVTLGALSTGVFLWLVYGVALGSVPIIAANATTFVLTAALLALKIIHTR